MVVTSYQKKQLIRAWLIGILIWIFSMLFPVYLWLIFKNWIVIIVAPISFIGLGIMSNRYANLPRVDELQFILYRWMMECRKIK